MNEVIDVYLTPRFWKGELIYDGRRPLLVYQQPVHRPHIDDTKPYPPSYTRKLEPSDGLLYQLSQLKNVKQTNTGIKMLVCVTMYNEPIQFLQRTLVGLYSNFRTLVKERGMSYRDIAVVIIQDGILKMVSDPLHRRMSSSIRFFEEIDFKAGNSECKLVSRIHSILDQIDEFQRNQLTGFIKNNDGLPPTIPKNVSLLYQFQWQPSRELQQQYGMEQMSETQMNLQILACFKHQNGKKLSSHLWFFEGFCRLLNPEFCTLMDIGTQPYETGLLNFIEALESNPKIGGVSGFMTLDIQVKSSESLMKKNQLEQKSQEEKEKIYQLEEFCSPIPIISTVFFLIILIISKILEYFGFLFVKFCECFHGCFSAQRAQLFEYNFSHMFDKNFESFFGYLNVLPGAWSAYRYEAISRGNRYEQNLLEKNYLKMVLDPNYTQKDYKEANVYLAEDRVLCLGIYCQNKQNFHLQYVPQAMAKTDPMDNLIDLLIQRRRWVNSSYFAFDYVYKSYSYDVRESGHGFMDRNVLLPTIMFFSKLSIINTYFGPAIFMFALFTSTHEAYAKILPPEDFIRSEPWVILPGFLCFGYVGTILALVIICLQKKASQYPQAYIVISSILGLYNLILIGIVVAYILLNYFLAEEIPESAALTREIIKYLIIINFACLVLPIFLHLFTHPRRVLEMLDPRTFLSYLYYQAAYSHTFVIYAFCNVDDITWGTKGAYDKKTSQFYTHQQQTYYDCKVRFMGKWIAANGVVSFLLILINDIFVEEQNKAVILTAIGLYSTVIVAIKCIFGMIHHLKCLFLQLFCLRKINYDEKQQQELEQRLQQRTKIQRNSKMPTNIILQPDFMDDLYKDMNVQVQTSRYLAH